MKHYYMPFEKDEYMQRLAKVKAKMEERGLDALVVTDPANICYVTGYDAWSFYVPQAVLVALNDEIPYFVGRSIDALSGVVKTTYLDEEHVRFYPDNYLHNPPRHPMQYIGTVIADLGYGNCHFGVEMDAHYFTAKAFEELKSGLPNATFEDAERIINWVKLIKSDKEIELIRNAGKIVEKSMQTAFDVIAPGVRQCDAVAEIMKSQIAGTEEFGGDYPSIMPLLPFGELAGACHLTWTDEVYPDDVTIYIELAGVYKRYHCPMARTISLGEPEPLVYEGAKITIEGLNAALDKAKPGVTAEEVERAYHDVIAKYGMDKENRIGYSTGLNFPPDWGEQTVSIRPGNKTVLQPNMVFHSIPGFYQENWGVEISQTFRITETGIEKMSNFPMDVFIKK